MARRVETIGYREYGNGRYTHKRGIQMKDSWVSRMIRELQEFNTVTRAEFILRYRPHLTVQDVTQGGWGTSMWAALVRSGIIEKTPYRRKNRQVIFVRGPDFEEYEKIRSFFEDMEELTWDEIEQLRHIPSAFEDRETFELFRNFFHRDTPHSYWTYDDEDDNWSKYGKYD